MIVVKISGFIFLLLLPVCLIRQVVVEEIHVNAPGAALPVIGPPCGDASRPKTPGALASGGDHAHEAGKSFGIAPACKVDLDQARQNGLPLFPDAALR